MIKTPVKSRQTSDSSRLIGKKAGKTPINLNGASLSIEDIIAIGNGKHSVDLDAAAVRKCELSHAFLAGKIETDRIIYGVNTSFGPLCRRVIANEDLAELQANLVRSHAAAMGNPIDPCIARGIAVVRLNCLVKGYSGVSPGLLNQMREMLNSGIAPYLPECGSVGASGDLNHLAHLALGIIGEGRVFQGGEALPACTALESAGLKPWTLGPKEALALLNGTSAMTGLAAYAIYEARDLLTLACFNAALGLEVFRANLDAYDPELHTAKGHPGQVRIAAALAGACRNSKNLVSGHGDAYEMDGNPSTHFETSHNVQDVYSIRCVAQILAPVWECIRSGKEAVETEANSANDNPLVFPESGKILHGGNFHGQSIGYAMDCLRIGLSTLCTLSERRLNKLLDPALNHGLPAHLSKGPVGLDTGLMGAQYLATSISAEARHLANPVSIHSISCNASNQDVVSMGTVAARKAIESSGKVKHALCLETMALLQASRLTDLSRLGDGLISPMAILNRDFEIYSAKSIIHEKIEKLEGMIFGEEFMSLLRHTVDIRL